MRFNVEQVILFGGALLVLFLVAGYFFVSPLDWLETVLHEFVSVASEKHTVPTTPKVTLSPTPSLDQARRDKDALPPRPPLRYENVSPVLIEALGYKPQDQEKYAKALAEFSALPSQEGDDLEKLIQKLEARSSLSAQEWREVSAGVSSAQGFLKQMTELADSPTYSMDGFDLEADADRAARALHEGVTLLCLQAFELAKDKQGREAMRKVGQSARLAKAMPIAPMELQKEQTASMGRAIGCWSQLVEAENEVTILEISLQAMNALSLSQHDALSQVREPVARDLLSRLRSMTPGEMAGEIERFAPDYLLKKYAAQKEKALEKLAAVAPDDPRVAAARKKFDEEYAHLSEQVREALERRQQADLSDGSVATTPSLSAQRAAEQVVQAKLDLLRAKTAGAIAAKTGHDVGKDMEALVPRYLPFEPKDPFSLENYKIDATGQLVYSVGPDGQDAGLQVVYDPTNGVISCGDVALSSSAAENP